MEKELTYEEIEYGHTIYEPDEMKFESTDELDEILQSEEFECYFTSFAKRNPYYARTGLALRQGRYVMDLIRATKAARLTYDGQLKDEGTTFEEYKEQHYCECMICRDDAYSLVCMPNERWPISLRRIMGHVGKLTDKQMERYNKQVCEMSEEEIKTNLEKARTWKDLFGWKHTLDQDIRYDVDTEDYDNEEE